jgi:hypothetical protein
MLSLPGRTDLPCQSPPWVQLAFVDGVQAAESLENAPVGPRLPRPVQVGWLRPARLVPIGRMRKARRSSGTPRVFDQTAASQRENGIGTVADTPEPALAGMVADDGSRVGP